MPYPSILKDLNAKAIPQVYDGNNFQPDTGKRILYGPDGTTPLSVVDSKLGVRTTELETLIGEVQAAPTPNTMLARLKELETYLSTISQKDYATQATLSALNTAFGNEDFSSEITLASVLTKLTELDNKIDAISNADNMNVTQSGSNVSDNVIANGIYTSDQSTTLQVPDGVKGGEIFLDINGVTGTFGVEEGICILAAGKTPGGTYLWQYKTEITNTSNRAHQIVLYPGISNTNTEFWVSSSRFVFGNIIIPRNLYISVAITGTFVDVEGIDCEVNVEWWK